MSLDLAYLVLERCPLRGQPFRALLVLALDADDDDCAFVSHSKLARWGRFTRARAQEMVAFLSEQNWIHKDGGDRRRISRRRLMSSPLLPGPRPRSFAGHTGTQLERRAEQTAHDLLALHEFHNPR